MTTGSTPPKKSFITRNEIIFIVLFLVIVGTAYGVGVTSALSSTANRNTGFTASTDTTDTIHVKATVLTVDPLKQQEVVRLEFTPGGNLTKDEGRTPAETLRLETNTISGAIERVFDKGKRMSPIEVTLQMYDGDISTFPIDTYKADLILEVFTVPAKPTTPAAATDASTPAADNGPASVPTDVDFTADVNGYKFDSHKGSESTADYNVISMNVQRSSPLIIFSLFILAIIGILSLTVFVVVIALITRNRKFEFGMFAWIGAMIFAFPAVRNSLPGVPPLGADIDYIIFFWALGLVSVSLFIAAIVYLTRPAVNK